MKRFSLASSLPAAVAAIGLAITSSAFAPANAYSVTKSTQTAGNPEGFLWDVNIDKTDIGRIIDPIKWLVPAGTVGDKNKPPLQEALKAEAVIKVWDIKSNSVELEISMRNLTANLQAAIVSFGFGINPDGTSVILGDKGYFGNVFDNLIIQNPDKSQNFAGGYKNIDFCAFSDGCNGGDIKNGLQAGGSDTLRFIINTDPNKNNLDESGVTLSGFGLKFQTEVGSFEPVGVPEPLTVVGSGLALGFGALLKRESSKKRKKAVVKS